MAEIKSNSKKINTSATSVKDFLSDLNNIESLMPEDKIHSWQSDKDACSFTIKGLSGIGMKREQSENENQIHLVSHGKNPFDFSLDINIIDKGESCETQIVFEGNMNFMILTMAKAPLGNLFNAMSEKLAAKFS